ncbi:MAG: TIGR04283 family arsenosugar biosynthesis glycosyltransferase [Sedimentisphaerales bacterium]
MQCRYDVGTSFGRNVGICCKESLRKGRARVMEHIRQTPSEHMFSVVVPVLNEAKRINSLIKNIRGLRSDGFCEIIVVDGDPQGATIQVIQDKDVVCIISGKARARQMNSGAAKARGKVLIFLHADTKLPSDALQKIRKVLENEKYVAGAFDLGIDSDKLLLKTIAACASLRSRLHRVPYGDQAIFIRRRYFGKIGGFKEIPLMEDVELMVRIKKRGDSIFILRDRVITSARRWQKEGIIYTTLRNIVIRNLFRFGVSPDRLAKYYKADSMKGN